MVAYQELLTKIITLVFILFLLSSCGGSGAALTTESEIVFEDFYWQKLSNDNPGLFKSITLTITFFVTGSPETLKEKFMLAHPEYADFFEGSVVVGYAHNDWDIKQVWIVGKINEDGVYVPPIILAHEVLELLSRNDPDNQIVNPHDYNRLMYE